MTRRRIIHLSILSDLLYLRTRHEFLAVVVAAVAGFDLSYGNGSYIAPPPPRTHFGIDGRRLSSVGCPLAQLHPASKTPRDPETPLERNIVQNLCAFLKTILCAMSIFCFKSLDLHSFQISSSPRPLCSYFINLSIPRLQWPAPAASGPTYGPSA